MVIFGLMVQPLSQFLGLPVLDVFGPLDLALSDSPPVYWLKYTTNAVWALKNNPSLNFDYMCIMFSILNQWTA